MTTKKLIIGLGGAGCSVVGSTAAKLAVAAEHGRADGGSYLCIGIDSDMADLNDCEEQFGGVPYTHFLRIGLRGLYEHYFYMYDSYPDGERVKDWFPAASDPRIQKSDPSNYNLRAGAKLAFMNAAAMENLREIERVLADEIRLWEEGNVSVIIVTSLAGSTGSGMFLQTALWLRRWFRLRHIYATFAGYFIMPDVFTGCYPVLGERGEERLRLNANAYAALKELDAVNRCLMDGDEIPSVMPGFCYTEIPEKPLYDDVCLYSNMNGNGEVVTSFSEAVENLSDIVCVRAAFPANRASLLAGTPMPFFYGTYEGELFGADGMAKAVYPENDIMEYCALRHFQQELDSVWMSIGCGEDSVCRYAYDQVMNRINNADDIIAQTWTPHLDWAWHRYFAGNGSDI